MKYLHQYTPEIILVIFLMLFMGFRSPERNWDRIINSDGKGYYAYLPAIFIYHDLQFRFVEQYEAQYYPSDRSVFKEFRYDTGRGTVNKYFPGMAIVWLPFFLFGHLMAWLELFPRDGYSLPYQYSILLSALMFLWLGARWLMKLLKLYGASDGRAAFLTLAVTLGTNLVFFTVTESSMTHVYSFALVTYFLLITHRLFHDYRPKWFPKAVSLFALIVLIRPTNALILLLVPFLAGSAKQLMFTFRRVFSNRALFFRGMAYAVILFSVPVTLWILQTGRPLVYSYGEEKLNLFRPHMLNILFSFNRGWFVYTPLALLSLAGFGGLFRHDRYRFLWLAGFLFVFVYVASCWWVWYYASKCGQRVFIDLYALVALLLLFLYHSLKGTLARRLLSALIVLFIGLNLFQYYQHTRWIYPPWNINAEIFRDSFFSLNRKARIYIPEEAVVNRVKRTNDMETAAGPAWMNPATRTDSVRFGGQWSSRADRRIPYSVGIETGLDSLFTTPNRLILVRAMILAPREKTEATLVVDYQANGRSVSYNQFILEPYVSPDRWTKVETAFYVPRELPAGSTVKVYFFNPSAIYKLYVDDLDIEFLTMKDEPDYRKIEGVQLAEQIKRLP
ncbi:MAG TPA: hypothetical protein PKG48_05110 [Bacteroidales bacterium]|nr:hypothetical protein [Bacteroidales bacterium]HPS62302.1 hypothetical protein [Bacteroidales bacterium]